MAANVFVKNVNKSNIGSLLSETFTKDLATASINVLTATVIGTNRDQVQVKLTLGHSSTSETKEVTITVTNLTPAPESEEAQAALDAIVDKVNHQSYATKAVQINSTFVDNVTKTPANLSGLLADSFASTINGATVSKVTAATYDANSATEVTLTVVLTYPRANNQTVTITVSNLLSAQAYANSLLLTQAQNVVKEYSNTSVSVNESEKGINTKAMSDLLTAAPARSLPTKLVEALKGLTYSIEAISYVPTTGTEVSVRIKVVPYTGAEALYIQNLNLTGLVSYGVADGDAYLSNALETATTNALATWSSVAQKSMSTVTADRFATTTLVQYGTDGAAKLKALQEILGLTDAQVKAISSMTLTVPSLSSVSALQYNFDVEYNGAQGKLYLVLNVTGTGLTQSNGTEIQSSYSASYKVDLSRYISFKSGHYDSLASLVEEANKETFTLSSRRTAQEWIDYYRPSYTRPVYNAITMLSWMADDTHNDILKQIYSKTRMAEITNFQTTGYYSFNLQVNLTDQYGEVSTLNINFESPAPEVNVVNTNLSLYNNYALTYLFSRSLDKQKETLLKVINNSGAGSVFASLVSDFQNLSAINYEAQSSTSTDTVIFTLVATDGTTQKIGLKFLDLKVAPISAWIQTAVTAQAFELITQAKWIRNKNQITNQVWSEYATWTKGEVTTKLLYYRQDSLMQVEGWLNQANGVNKIVMTPYNELYANQLALATFQFVVTGFDGASHNVFDHTYVVQYYNAQQFGGADWNNPNWNYFVPQNGLADVYAKVLAAEPNGTY